MADQVAFDSYTDCHDDQKETASSTDLKVLNAFRDFPLLGPLSPFGVPKAYYDISDSVSTNLDPKTRILLHLVSLVVLSSASRKLPKTQKSMEVERYIEAAVVERCGLEEIEEALLHAELYCYDMRETWQTMREVFDRKSGIDKERIRRVGGFRGPSESEYRIFRTARIEV